MVEVKNYTVKGNEAQKKPGLRFRSAREYWIKRSKDAFLNPFPREPLTQEEFQRACAMYIYDTITLNILPTFSGFSLYIGRNYRDYEELYPEIFDLFEQAILAIKFDGDAAKKWNHTAVAVEMLNNHGYFTSNAYKPGLEDPEEDEEEPVEVMFINGLPEDLQVPDDDGGVGLEELETTQTDTQGEGQGSEVQPEKPGAQAGAPEAEE